MVEAGQQTIFILSVSGEPLNVIMYIFAQPIMEQNSIKDWRRSLINIIIKRHIMELKGAYLQFFTKKWRNLSLRDMRLF